MNDFEKTIAVGVVEETIESAVKEMSSATLQMLFTCFADKDFSHFAKTGAFLDFLAEVTKYLPDEAKEEVLDFAYRKIGSEAEKRCKDNLKKHGVDVNAIEKIIDNNKKEKKDKKVAVKKETKTYRVKDEDELRDLLKEIIGNIEKEIEDAD